MSRRIAFLSHIIINNLYQNFAASVLLDIIFAVIICFRHLRHYIDDRPGDLLTFSVNNVSFFKMSSVQCRNL